MLGFPSHLPIGQIPVSGWILALMICMPSAASGQEPAWYPWVIAPPEVRTVIQETPMELRPYRPLHIWGNTVRRMYYRGNPLPAPRDLLDASDSVLRSRPLPVPAPRSLPGIWLR